MNLADSAHVAHLSALLESVGLRGPWTFETPHQGITGSTVHCHRNDVAPEQVVVKFTAPTPAHQRLADLGVGCRVLACGGHDDQPFHAQEFLDGTPRTWAWMAEHANQVIELVARFATDPELTRELQTGASVDLTQHRRTILDETLGWLNQASDPALARPDRAVAIAIEQLTVGADSDNDCVLMPSHTDVNNTNVPVAHRRPGLGRLGRPVLVRPGPRPGHHAVVVLPSS